jgi:carbonic anhydrase/acetyltransferase-like protein (isoleucine patch superfamily)
VLESTELVQIGRNTNIDASARIHGPAIIGDNVTIGAGSVIDNCIIGNNVTVSQGCQLMLSVVGDGCFLPFRASLFMTTMMENTMVAQNTCLQLCVVGRDTFIGAGTTFTDFNILPAPLKATMRGQLEETNFIVLGGCVGHHCRLGSGLVIYPARTIESDVVLLSTRRAHRHHQERQLGRERPPPLRGQIPVPAPLSARCRKCAAPISRILDCCARQPPSSAALPPHSYFGKPTNTVKMTGNHSLWRGGSDVSQLSRCLDDPAVPRLAVRRAAFVCASLRRRDVPAEGGGRCNEQRSHSRRRR